MRIGQVTRPHGIRGEVRVVVHTDQPERFAWLKAVYVGESEPVMAAVESVRFHQNLVLLKLAGIDSREAAEALRGAWLQVPLEDAIPLEEGEYYYYQLIGLAVITDAGEPLGTLRDVIETRANAVLVVQGPRGELLLPDIDSVVQQIDLDRGQIVVTPLPGLLPDAD